MLLDAVKTGESKPDNPNIAEDRRVLGYLNPLRKKIQTGEGDLELSAAEAGQLDKLLKDAQSSLECTPIQVVDELAEARKLAKARKQRLDDEDLSLEARAYRERKDILNILKPLSKRLDEAKFEWPKQYED